MKAFVTTARIDAGTIGIRHKSQLEAWAKQQKDGEYVIRIERLHATRSLEQNGAYWAAYVTPLSEHTGYSCEEIHEILKAKFIPKRVAMQDGNGVIVDEYVIGGTTTTLDRVQFGEFLRAVEVWAATELGVILGVRSDRSAA